MKIVGGPEELATFVRCAGGEKTEWLDAAPAFSVATPPKPPPLQKDEFSSLIVLAVAFLIMWLLLRH